MSSEFYRTLYSLIRSMRLPCYPSKLMHTKQLEHLGIVAGIVGQLNLEERVN